MRAVARRAGVDPALVHYFFDSKANLFAAAVAQPESNESLRHTLAHAARPGEAMLRFHLQQLFVDRHESIAAMLRAALADPDSLPALRSFIEKALVPDVAAVLQGKDARLRAELAGAFMVGLFVVRHLVGVAPLASASIERVVDLAAPALNAVLSPRGRASPSRPPR